MILQEYDENLHISNEKEISYREGVEDGRRQEREETLKEKQRADEASQKADEASHQAMEEKQRADILTLLLQQKQEAEIAEFLNIPLETVESVIRSVQFPKESL